MISIGFSIDLLATPIGSEPIPLVEEVDLVMEHLVDLVESGCGVTDPAVSLDETTNVVSVEVQVVGEDFDDAVQLASSCVRSAIHAAGGHTPGWTVEQTSQRAELIQA